MNHERAVLAELMPGLDEKLGAFERSELESPGGPGLEVFRAADGPGLLAPRANGGLGATAEQAVAVQMAVGSRSGSLAVATTMHHFSLASLIALAGLSETGLEQLLVEAVCTQRHLLASGFSEGRPGAGILSPTMTATPAEGGVRVSGVKKPCSLSRSMTMLTASVDLAAGADTGPELAVVLVPAESPGLRVEPFWASPALAGAESDAVVLEDVLVPEALVVRTAMRPGGALDTTHRVGFVWFELLMTASYLGIAAGLVEEAAAQPRASDTAVAGLRAQVATTAHALRSLARRIDDGAIDEDLLAQVLLTRFQLQDALPALAAGCLEALGGMAFISSPELATRVASLHCLAFHPPSRARAAAPLRAHAAGGPLHFD